MITIYLIKISFILIFSFTFLNSIGILKFPLDFPWIVITLPTLLAWWFWEKVSRKKLAFPHLTGILLVLLVYGEGIGNVLDFYNKFGWYDKFTHFLGGIAIGLINFLIIFYWNQKYIWKLALNFLIIFALSLSLTIHVSWEFYEYFADLLNVKESNLIPDRYDTVDDLLFGFVGSIISVLFGAFFLQQPQTQETKKARKPL